jgi:hypothetical protein
MTLLTLGQGVLSRCPAATASLPRQERSTAQSSRRATMFMKCGGFSLVTQTDFCAAGACLRANHLSLTQLERKKFFEVLKACCRQHFCLILPMFFGIIDLQRKSSQPLQSA